MDFTTTFGVTGMTCGHCVRSVKGELGKLDGLTRCLALARRWLGGRLVRPRGQRRRDLVVELLGHR